MDMGRLEYFIKVAELLNFTQAANECGITQTAMSQYIGNLEKSLGFRLFFRTTRSVTLTPAGADFYDRAKQLVADYEKAVHHSADVANGKISIVTVLLPSSIDGNVLMPRFQAFQKQYPLVKQKLSILDTQSIVQRLREGLCDIAVSWPYEFNRSTTTTYTIAEFDLDVLCSPEHPFANKKKLTFAEIARENLYSVDLTQMPRTRFNIERNWADLGYSLPDQSVKQDVLTIEEIGLRMRLDPSIIVLVPVYYKHFLPAHLYSSVPLDEPLKFHLAATMQKDNLRPEVARLAKALADPRVPLDY